MARDFHSIQIGDKIEFYHYCTAKIKTATDIYRGGGEVTVERIDSSFDEDCKVPIYNIVNIIHCSKSRPTESGLTGTW